MSEQLEQREVTRAIAELIGYTDIHDGIHPFTHDLVYMGVSARSLGIAIPIPNYHDDLNAVFVLCDHRGYGLELRPATVTVLTPGKSYTIHRLDKSPQEAAARALLSALQAVSS